MPATISPTVFKNRANGADSVVMSDTAAHGATTTTPDSSFFLDGTAPRLSTGQPTRPDRAPAPSLPVVSPVLASAESPVLPTLPATSPATTPAESAAPHHAMAHLMPEQTAPSESSRRAAEIRAAKKAKARKVKIGVVAGVLAVSALAGPPLFRWLRDAVNESGRVSSDAPVEQPED
jgi:hypothetical protein